MSVTLSHNPQKKILYITVIGPLLFEEFSATMEQISHSDEYPPDIPTLWDLRETDIQGWDQTFLKKILRTRKEYGERMHAKVSLIASSDLAYGMGRMFEALSQDAATPQKIMVFRDFEEGENWLLAHDSKTE
jgi:hypothetical protein